MTDDYYPTIDTNVISETKIIDPTQPGQLAVIPPEAHGDVVQTVFQYLPAQKQTQQSIDALFMCLAQAPREFADIARRHQVGPTEITVNHHHEIYNTHHHQDTYDNGTYYQQEHYYQPHFNPTISVKPYINIDANALAQSRSYQDNSGDNRFWVAVFAIIGLFAIVAMLDSGN